MENAEKGIEWLMATAVSGSCELCRLPHINPFPLTVTYFVTT